MRQLHSSCRFRLPLQYNDGREIEPEKLVKILQALDRQFGGYTPLGVSEGSWGGQVEPMQTIEVAVPPSRIAELEVFVRAVGRELGQHAMYFDAPAPSVRFLPPAQDDEHAAAAGQ